MASCLVFELIHSFEDDSFADFENQDPLDYDVKLKVCESLKSLCETYDSFCDGYYDTCGIEQPVEETTSTSTTVSSTNSAPQDISTTTTTSSSTLNGTEPEEDNTWVNGYCGQCQRICFTQWSYYGSRLTDSGSTYCPYCTDTCKTYIPDFPEDILVSNSSTVAVSPKETTQASNSGSDYCRNCDDICYEKWEDYADIREKKSPSYCPDCIEMCGNFGYMIDDYYVTQSTTPSTTTTDAGSMEEDCFLCGEICDWNCASYGKARENLGPDYCPSCVQSCNEFYNDLNLVDRTNEYE